MVLRLYQTLFLSLAFVFSSINSFAQNRYLDSLKRELENEHVSDSLRMEILMNIGNHISMNDASSARRVFLQTFTIAKKNKDVYHMGMAMSGMGSIYQYKSNYDSALYFYFVADSLYKLNSSESAIESAASNKASIADIERNRNHFEAAIKIYLEAIDLMERSVAADKWTVLGVMYSGIASVYHDLNEFSKTLEYDLKSLEACKKAESGNMYIATTELFVADDYKSLDKLAEARSHLENAERLANEVNSTDLFYRVYNTRGSYYQKTREYENAISSFKKALVYANQNGHLFQQMNCNRMIAFVYRDMKRYKESVLFLQKALAQVRELKNKLLEVELIKNLAKVQSALGNNKEAVNYYREYVSLNDSLNEEATKQKINEIENKYQSEKKQQAIIALQKNNQLQKAELRRKNTLNVALLAGFALLLLIAFLSYKNFKNKNRLLLQKEKLRDQHISELEQERKLVAAQSVMKGQEEERSRLARDLHDGVGGLLSGVKLSMSNMKGNVFLSEENARSFENVICQLDQSMAELRRVSHNMMPEALIKYGLKEALENYCENINLSGKIKVQLQAYGMEKRMEQSTEIIIYRMIQELLQNVIKHADAKNVLIQLVREEERFNLTVEDDGKGFDTKEIENKSGAGLANIKARAEYLDGNVDIVSKNGEGTSVNIEGSCG